MTITLLLYHSFHRLTSRWVGRRRRQNKYANRSDSKPGEGCELWDERRRHFSPSLGTNSNLIRKCNQYWCASQILQGLNFLYWYLKIKKAEEEIRFCFSGVSKEEERQAIDFSACCSFCGSWKLQPFFKITKIFCSPWTRTFEILPWGKYPLFEDNIQNQNIPS